MKIGTWNTQGRKPVDLHLELFRNHRCDVWLLTEVHSGWEHALLEAIDFQCILSDKMPKDQHWAAVAFPKSASVLRLPDPHPSSILVSCDDNTFCASILPWKDAKDEVPWSGSNHAARMHSVLKSLLGCLPREKLVWGGDWNHAISGNEVAGNKQGRAHLLEAVQELGLVVPTAELPSQVDGFQGERYLSIDHIAVPASWNVRAKLHIACKGLSDHDAYIIDVDHA